MTDFYGDTQCGPIHHEAGEGQFKEIRDAIKASAEKALRSAAMAANTSYRVYYNYGEYAGGMGWPFQTLEEATAYYESIKDIHPLVTLEAVVPIVETRKEIPNKREEARKRADQRREERIANA